MPPCPLAGTAGEMALSCSPDSARLAALPSLGARAGGSQAPTSNLPPNRSSEAAVEALLVLGAQNSSRGVVLGWLEGTAGEPFVEGRHASPPSSPQRQGKRGAFADCLPTAAWPRQSEGSLPPWRRQDRRGGAAWPGEKAGMARKPSSP